MPWGSRVHIENHELSMLSLINKNVENKANATETVRADLFDHFSLEISKEHLVVIKESRTGLKLKTTLTLLKGSESGPQ